MIALTPEQWVLLLGAVGALVASLVGSLKVLAEIGEIRARVIAADRTRSGAVEEARTAAVEVRQQLNSNGGTSIRDAIDRIEQAQDTLRTEVAGVRDAVGDVKADVRGVKRDIGRLADQDTTDRTEAGKAHERIDARIDWLRDTLLGRRRAMLEPEHDPDSKGKS